MKMKKKTLMWWSSNCSGLKWMVGLVVCVAFVAAAWPWNPELRIEEMSVKRVKVRPVPPGADVWITMSVRVGNHDVYWMEVRDVDVGMKYRRKKMGHVESKGWLVRSWTSTHVGGDLQFTELPSSEVPHLLEDVAKGQVYLRTVIELTGQFGFLTIRTPLEFKTVLACEVLVNTKNHSIILQHCLHKD